MSTGYRVTVRQGWSGKEEVLNSERLETLRLNSAQITKDVTAYDQFTFSLSPTHPQFASFKPYTTFVRVTRPDKSTQLFSGRVIKISDGMDSSGVISKTITCEGLEGFLHDSVQPFKEFHDTTPLQFLQALINNHNAQVEDYKKIRLGTVSVTNSTDNVYRFLEDDKDTYANIQDKLISSLGGEIRVRENGGLVLDYQPTISGVANQDVVLARNMLSLQRDVDPTSIITVLKPLGATQTPENASDDSSGKAYPRLTISSVNSGSEYLRDDYLIDQFGVQEKSNVWDDVTTPAALLSKGKALMQAQRNIITQIQVSYVDLSHIAPNDFAEFKCGDFVNVISPLQGIQMQERITGMSIDLLNINSSTMTIGEDVMSMQSYEKMQQKQRQAEISSLKKQIEAQQKLVAGYDKKIGKISDDLKDGLDSNSKSFEKIAKELQKQIDELKNNGDGGTTPPDDWKAGTMFMDIADYQRGFAQADYNRLYSQGIKGVIIKLTQGSQAGTAYVNPYFNEQKSMAITSGMKFIGTYHYLVSTSVSDAQDEARWYLKQLQDHNVPKSAIVACDVEDPVLNGDKGTLTAELTSFHKVLLDAGYTNTADYSSSSWMTTRFTPQGKYKWIASWGLSNPPDGADAWQFASNFNGISLDVDRSYNRAFI